MLKKCKVVMLATNQKATEDHSNYPLHLTNGTHLFANTGFRHIKYDVPQHLYILSDDKIEEGDWYYDLVYNRIIQAGKITGNFVELSIIKDKGLNHSNIINLKKIIATTDNELYELTSDREVGGFSGNIPLPQPSQSFIQRFIEAYNSGKPITDVMVEYMRGVTIVDEKQWENHNLILKVDSNNTITIKRVKDSWNRDEVILLIKDSFILGKQDAIDFVTIPGHIQLGVEGVNKWIEDNL